MSIKIGKNCKLGKIKFNSSAEVNIGNNCIIQDNVIIDVDERLVLGDRSYIGRNSEIHGRDIEFGIEAYLDDYVFIGGGSCKEKLSQFKAGYWLHLDRNVAINTSIKVEIGNEVGIGHSSSLFTHGAYLSWLEGFPVQWGPITIGSHVYIASSTILPNVKIGNNVVVACMSLINKDVPDGCLVGGIPAHIIKDNCYPQKFTDKEIEQRIDELVTHFITNIIGYSGGPKKIVIDGDNKKRLYVDDCMTLFDFENMRIDGPATELCEKFKNECRRYGARFKYYIDNNGMYKSW